jgi:hypothetical protein
MQISGVSLTLTYPHRLCLLKVLLGVTTTATSFSHSKYTEGGDTAPTFSGWCVYIHFTWEVGFPPLLWSFPPTATFTSIPVLGCWTCAAAPTFSGWLVYLRFHEGFPLSPSSVHRAPCCLYYMCFFYWLLFSISFFPGWGLVCPGGYADLAHSCL